MGEGRRGCGFGCGIGRRTCVKGDGEGGLNMEGHVYIGH